MKKIEKMKMQRALTISMLFVVFSLVSNQVLAVGDIKAALESVLAPIKNTFETAKTIMYAVAALCGIIGAVMLYQKWNSGDPNTGKLVGAWIGAGAFLAVAATFLEKLFLK